MLIFGMGYAASRLAEGLLERGWDVGGTTRDGRTGTIPFENKDLVLERLRSATHILSSVLPDGTFDPVLASYGDAIAVAPATWVGYLSSDRSEEGRVGHECVSMCRYRWSL